MTCAMLQIRPGHRESISLSQGAFVRDIVKLIERVNRDQRLKNAQVELRVILAPALHFGGLWLKGKRGTEHFVVATPGRQQLKFGRWLHLTELEDALHKRAKRLIAEAR